MKIVSSISNEHLNGNDGYNHDNSDDDWVINWTSLIQAWCDDLRIGAIGILRLAVQIHSAQPFQGQHLSCTARSAFRHSACLLRLQSGALKCSMSALVTAKNK